MFSNLTQGSIVHVLSTKDDIKYSACTIEMLKPSFSYNFNTGAIVDITVTLDGQKKEFSGISANSSVSIANGYIITDNKENMISQIENILQTDRDIINNIDKKKKDISDYENILKKLNPVFAKETAMNSAITDLSSRVDKMQSEFGDIKSDMKKVLSLLTDKND